MSRPYWQSARFVCAMTFAGVFALLVASRFTVFFRLPLLESGDLAVNALQIHEAKSFGEIYGNYSRYEFNHPGPVFFYVYAIAERVLHDWLGLVPSPGNAHLLAGAALQSGFFALGLGLLSSVVRWRAFVPLTLAGAAWYFGTNREALTSIWPPHVLALPLFCFLAAGTVVAMGRLRHAGWLVLAGGFLFHGHVVMPLFVAVSGGLALGLGFWIRRRGDGWLWREIRLAERRSFWLAGGLVALFVLPLAIDVATRGSRGNVAAILGRIAFNAHEHPSLGQSLLFFFSFPVVGREHDRVLTTVGPETWRFLREFLPLMLVCGGVLLGPSLLAWRLRRRLGPDAQRFFLAGGAMLTAAVVSSVVWGLAQSGGVRHYNGFFLQGIYFFGGLLGVALLAWRLENRWRGLMSLAVVALAFGFAGYELRGKMPWTDERGQTIRDGVAAALAEDADRRPKLLVFDHRSWHIGAAVAVELTRRGIDCYTLPWWSYMFQRRHDASQFGVELEARTETWWIGPPGAGGEPLTSEVALFREPAPLVADGGEIDFELGGNAFRYLVTGLMDSDADNASRTNERRLVLRFRPQAATHEVRLVFDAAAEDAARGASVAEVFFSGVAVGRVSVGARAAVSVAVPAALWNAQPVATLELRFPGAVARRSSFRPDYERWVAWRLWRIRCERP